MLKFPIFFSIFLISISQTKDIIFETCKTCDELAKITDFQEFDIQVRQYIEICREPRTNTWIICDRLVGNFWDLLKKSKNPADSCRQKGYCKIVTSKWSLFATS
ncbi:unnamed protein product [Caenorhabditis angaria]|uniref:Saposin B-type domain-containing protein n=1 Tax=Caenorhabditis angaria TaxID=860376 RepID=A0A9P1IRT9_9PELO|nr:unnamed protein product [Caenorhabditis angaria]